MKTGKLKLLNSHKNRNSRAANNYYFGCRLVIFITCQIIYFYFRYALHKPNAAMK